MMSLIFYGDENMADEYSKHVEKRIKEIRERMIKSNLHSTRKNRY